MKTADIKVGKLYLGRVGSNYNQKLTALAVRQTRLVGYRKREYHDGVQVRLEHDVLGFGSQIRHKAGTELIVSSRDIAREWGEVDTRREVRDAAHQEWMDRVRSELNGWGFQEITDYRFVGLGLHLEEAAVDRLLLMLWASA